MVQESGRGELESFETEIIETYRKKQQGVVPLVIEVDSIDIMANLLRMKLDVEDKIGSRMRMVFSGAMEAHLLAKEISKLKSISISVKA